MRKPLNLQWIVVLAGLASAGCTTTSSGLDNAPTAVQRVTELSPPTASFAGAPEFRLGPNDYITVEVLGVPELRRDGRIDGSGRFSFPLIGSIQAAGMTTEEFAQLVSDGLRGRYVRNPQVSVNVTDFSSQVVTVDGAVSDPGRYPVPGRMTLQQAIASANGLTDAADITEVVVFRTVEGRAMAALFSLKDIREGRYADPAIYPQDVVIVGTSRARRLWAELAQLSPLFGVFTPLIYVLDNN